MIYKNYYDLPEYLRRRISKFENINIDEWVKQPIPALNNKSILEALSNGNEEGVRRVIDRVEEALEITE